MGRISITIEKNLLKEIDKINGENRSKVIREAVEYYIKKYDWLRRIESKLGEVSLIYNPKGKKDIIELESKYKDIIIVSLETRFNNKILRITAIKGDREKIIEFVNKLKGLKNVEMVKLTTISIK
ncbi:transcriptional regulator NikR, CopG family protein [Methanocaldococcus villosus KIN24-T80]|uniref:Transcriptional regulator NikR, CopG family protein n=1 Tax=Methanocaldococcus villosus KIN24-T80 TaxID=1069083 RepID=N6VZW4_9EURY|nr:CopG family ribbon-helix-helix protein [Methanocaldococcus villosus]ENN96627.1 transcriptional regulator NikR, CopG family protein [Methanocaldococcus villosus KIN24-T80]